MVNYFKNNVTGASILQDLSENRIRIKMPTWSSVHDDEGLFCSNPKCFSDDLCSCCALKFSLFPLCSYYVVIHNQGSDASLYGIEATPGVKSWPP